MSFALSLDELIANLSKNADMSKEASAPKTDEVTQTTPSVSSELEQLLSKQAEENQDNQEMSKEATEKGNTLADAIVAALVKIAQDAQATVAVAPAVETVEVVATVEAEKQAEEAVVVAEVAPAVEAAPVEEVEKEASHNQIVEAAQLEAEGDEAIEDMPDSVVQELFMELISRVHSGSAPVEEPTPAEEFAGETIKVAEEIDFEKLASETGVEKADLEKLAQELSEMSAEDLEKLAEEVQYSQDQIEKAAAVSELVSEGHDFESAVELVKLAEEEILAEQFEMAKMAAVAQLVAEGKTADEAVAMVKEAAESHTHEVTGGQMLRGFISPAWMRSNIAKSHGKDGAGSWGRALESHAGGTARVGLRGYGEAVGAGVLAAAPGVILKNKQMAIIGGALGALAGAGHGIYSSLKNQGAEAHAEFSKKTEQEELEKEAGALKKVVGEALTSYNANKGVAGHAAAARNSLKMVRESDAGKKALSKAKVAVRKNGKTLAVGAAGGAAAGLAVNKD